MGRHRPHGKRTCKMNITMLSTTASGSADLKRIYRASTEPSASRHAALWLLEASLAPPGVAAAAGTRAHDINASKAPEREPRTSGRNYRLHSVAQQPLEVTRERLQLLAAVQRKGNIGAVWRNAIKRLKVRNEWHCAACRRGIVDKTAR
jgi:hypothetical protein